MSYISRFCSDLLGRNNLLSKTCQNGKLFQQKMLYSSNTDDNDPETSNKGSNRMLKYFKSVKKVDSNQDFLIDAELSGIGSSIAAMCWHKYSNSSGSTEEHEQYINSDTCTDDSTEFIYQKQNSDGDTLNDRIEQEMHHLLSVERAEKERIRLLMEKKNILKIDEQIRDRELKIIPSTSRLLSIASDISGRNPSHAKPQLDTSSTLKDESYQERLGKVDETFQPKNKILKANFKNKSSVQRETIRILDVDRLPLGILHHMICYTLVKHMPAEVVLKIISRLATFRDKDNLVSYQTLFRHISNLATPICRAELVAILSRGYQSISIPFMVDYVRKFGTFSRKFIAGLLDKHSQPLPLDFIRYPSTQRNISQVLTRPWALSTFVNLLKNSSAKRYMYLNLLNFGYVPNVNKFDSLHAFGTLDPNISNQILAAEKLLCDDIVSIQNDATDPNRPALYDKILELHHSGQLNEHLLHDEDDLSNLKEYENPCTTSTQLIKIVQYDPEPKEEQHMNDDGLRYLEDDRSIPQDRRHISWNLPWGAKRDEFHFKGKSYKLNTEKGWIKVKSNVRINYLKNIKMNQRKRFQRQMKRRATNIAKLKILNELRVSST
ncbi:conserved hypothetical protein [Theileria equi strain WA]|uniref:Uncharacterized protein n=1 Tax=Theileria equi strain WA TaxID=1537102 RepID=L1LCN6_THEEQ|nr:conserved hypothetical protein [Theileria equi strain WA]EKX73197.1 conserved hypothetical protein [Theileria equi strain WA]|eukprot:XP_004832649.1 conserved hypothetical protein [Theileria equi strain WA]